MLLIRKANDRGKVKLNWLDSSHTFSFGNYYDPDHMGYSVLRVINEDQVAPSSGFEPHPHENMEIISYIIEGSLTHKDSMGHVSTIRPGDIQIMSAGSGITHSELNGSNQNDVHFLQIWIKPKVKNQKPRYHQKTICPNDIQNQFSIVISEEGSGGTLPIMQDAKISVGKFESGMTFTKQIDPIRKYWLQIVRGQGKVQSEDVFFGDGVAIEQVDHFNIVATHDLEVILIDLP